MRVGSPEHTLRPRSINAALISPRTCVALPRGDGLARIRAIAFSARASTAAFGEPCRTANAVSGPLGQPGVSQSDAPDNASPLPIYRSGVTAPRRTTVYFDPDVHRALRLKAAANDRSLSETVNAALRSALGEDADDLAAAKQRRHERAVDFEDFVQSMRRRGKL
jgi:Arc/MetJ family transcription regulator